MEWFFIILIGFIAIAFPVLLFIAIWMMPWYIIILYFLWLAASVWAIVKSNGVTWKEKLTIPTLLTVLFSIIFLIAMLGNNEMFEDGEAIGAFFAAPFFSLPAIYFVGDKIRFNVRLKTKERYEEEIKKIQQEISQCDREIRQIEKQVDQKTVIVDFLKLISLCGVESSYFLTHPNVKAIEDTTMAIRKKHELISVLSTKKKQLEEYKV